uniref:Uncharacterized protein n=1 Tax=viral metagenome TaxID=1070528 RepID=A0A6M3XEV9_9ZZZZ
MKCKHDDYEVRQVMDMKFCVCKCGFQWKGDKPHNKPDKRIYQGKEREILPNNNI